MLLVWHCTGGMNLNSIPCGAQALLSWLTGVSSLSRSCRQMQAFLVAEKFSRPGSTDGNFTDLGFPWEFSFPSLPSPVPVEGTHHPCLQMLPAGIHPTILNLTSPKPIWTSVIHAAYLGFPSLFLIPGDFPFLSSSVIFKIAFGETLFSTCWQNGEVGGVLHLFSLAN